MSLPISDSFCLIPSHIFLELLWWVTTPQSEQIRLKKLKTWKKYAFYSLFYIYWVFPHRSRSASMSLFIWNSHPLWKFNGLWQGRGGAFFKMYRTLLGSVVIFTPLYKEFFCSFYFLTKFDISFRWDKNQDGVSLFPSINLFTHCVQ